MKVLVLGSIVLDVYMEIDQLPRFNEDVNTKDLRMSLGGMAYNVYNVLNLFKVDSILGCPIGEGTFSDIVKEMLSKKGHQPIGVIKNIDNGMCLCLVDDSKDRSFISHHGAEYRFDPNLFSDIDFKEISWIYASGLEIEDHDGLKIIEFLEEKNKNIFLALGPRVDKINKDYLKRLYKLKPVLHLNEREAYLISNINNVFESITKISKMTNNTVIITLGSKGTLLKEINKEPLLIETNKVDMIDATGAGDNHAGSILACLNMGLSYVDAIKIANIISSYVVRQKGSNLTNDNFKLAFKEISKIYNLKK